MSITSSLSRVITNYDTQSSIGSKFRAARIAPLMQMIEEVHRIYGSVRIIDIGGTEQYWSIISADFLEQHNVSISIINIPGPDLPEDHDRFHFVAADGCDLKQFENKSFHIAHSNSVIEHVGDWSRMQAFAAELKRVAPRFFIQTPNYWFPIEPHYMTPFFHWLPLPARTWLLMHFQLGSFRKAGNIDEAMRKAEDARLLTYRMFQSLFQEAEIQTEKFCFLSKSLIAYKK